MVILTLLNPQTSQAVQQWRFEHESLIRIGRSPENHIVLSDPTVSRLHLELRKIALPTVLRRGAQTAQGWQLINYSSNGTFVDGEEIAQGILEDTVSIQLAQDGPILKFEPQAASNLRPERSIPQSPATIAQPLSTATAPTHCAHAGNPSENLFCIHCGQPIHVQKEIRQYQVLRVLGKGGMGTTYLVWNPAGVSPLSSSSQGQLQVLKEMNANVAKIPKAQELFEREASTLKTLKHPGIPKYYDFFLEVDKKYLVMELVHGLDMEKHIRRTGVAPVKQAVEWMIQTCEVLNYLHQLPVPIIHRDIKPGNLLIRNLDKRIVVLDFGAVKEVGMPTGTRIGAEGYSAPEQVQGRPVTQSDLYAIGPSLIFLLTGTSPLRFYKRDDSFHQFNWDELTQIPRRLQVVIRRVTELNPSDRYQTAKELIRALRGCL